MGGAAGHSRYRPAGVCNGTPPKPASPGANFTLSVKAAGDDVLTPKPLYLAQVHFMTLRKGIPLLDIHDGLDDYLGAEIRTAIFMMLSLFRHAEILQEIVMELLLQFFSAIAAAAGRGPADLDLVDAADDLDVIDHASLNSLMLADGDILLDILDILVASLGRTIRPGLGDSLRRIFRIDFLPI